MLLPLFYYLLKNILDHFLLLYLELIMKVAAFES